MTLNGSRVRSPDCGDELKSIKEGGGGGIAGEVSGPEALEGAGRKVLAQMTELQNNYEDLREKFVERTES